MKRALHLETCRLQDGERLAFDLDVPRPAVLRHAYARAFHAEARVIGGTRRQGVLVVLVFEVEPDAPKLRKRYYALPYGQIAEGPTVAEMMYVATAALPNGAPIAVYEMTPSTVVAS